MAIVTPSTTIYHPCDTRTARAVRCRCYGSLMPNGAKPGRPTSTAMNLARSLHPGVSHRTQARPSVLPTVRFLILRPACPVRTARPDALSLAMR